jgi:hypothetical protein
MKVKQRIGVEMKTMSRMLVAMMLAAGATTIAFTPAVAADKARTHGETTPADCKAAAPGDKDKAMKPAPGASVAAGGQVAQADCKAVGTKSSKSRAEVKKETKEAVKAKEMMPPGEVVKK